MQVISQANRGRKPNFDLRAKIASLLAEGKTPTEIRNETGAGFTLIFGVKRELKAAEAVAEGEAA